MNKNFTKPTLIIFFLICLGVNKIFAQAGTGISFKFSAAIGVTAYPTVGQTSQIVPVASQDDFAYLFTPAGSVKFAGVTYSKIIVSTNGWLALTNAAAIPPALSSGGTYLSANQLSTYAGATPIIAPYWDDLSTTQISYNYTGGALWVRWTTKVDKTNALGSNLFWVRIDGTTGVINYYYTATAYTVSGSPTASIGLAGVCTGDYYSYNFPAGLTYADSTMETSNISTLPVNAAYTFTPYQLYDNCANAKDLSPLTATCTPQTFNINNAITSGSAICSTTDVADIWFKVTKPVGVSNVKVTTSPSSGCQPVSGTSVEVFASPCGGASLGCAITSAANPGYGDVTVTRGLCVSEVLYIRVTADGDVGGKFDICVKDAGAAPGAGSTCANPNWICSIPYNQAGLTTAGFGADYDSANSSCHDPFMNGEDYVFAYTPPTNTCLRISVTSTGVNPGVFVFDGCPNLLATTHCIASAVNSTGTLTINSVSLVAGTTYYFLVDNDTLGAAPFNIPFSINITNVGTSQTYDACGAVNLGSIANNQSCTFTTYTTECATPSVVAYPVPSCGSFTNNITGDIWLTFTAAFSGSLLIKTQPGSINPSSDVAMAVYMGNCIAMSLFACDDNSAGSNMPLLSIPVANGTTYYIRLWTVNPGNPGSFNLCITTACSPPNDVPCTAVFLAPGGSASGYNTCAGSGGEPPNTAQCVAGGTINTVWYKTVVPPSGQIKIRTHTHTLADTQIEAFLFPTGCTNAVASYVSKGCNDDGPDCGPPQGGQSYHDFSELTLTGLTPGDTLYVAVDGYNSQTGTFEITIIDGTQSYPPITGADCDGSVSICGPNPVTVSDPGILGYGNICDFQSNYDCWANGERNSAWYTVTVNPGVLQFDVQTLSDYDFIMWDITNVANPCSLIHNQTLPSIRCNWVTTVGGHTGISIPDPNADWEPAITVTGSPHTYLILIDDWNPPFLTTGYTINWMGSPIAANTTTVTWQGSTDTSFSNLSNWGQPPCNAVPSCSIDAIVSSSSSGNQPTINANMSVKNLTINAGATLRIKSPFTLDVCGNFTNNGTFIAEPGSTVRFVGTANSNQTISGALTGANSFANLVINKPATSGLVILNSNIDVSQSFTTMNNTSIFNINGKYMRVGGHFTNFNGTTTFTGIAASTVEFYKNVNQNFTNSSGSINLNKVVMNKPAGKVYLTGPFSKMNIDSTLTLTSGIIVTRSNPAINPPLEVNMKYYLPAAIIGNNATSYIDGYLRRKISNGVFSSPIIPASYDFPLGDSLPIGGYENANIKFTSATLVYDLYTTFTPWPGAVPPATGPVASECLVATYSNLPIFNNGYWTFKRSTANISGNYNISLFNTGETNNSGQGWTVAKADSALDPNLVSSWSLIGNCVITSTAGNTQRTNINPPPGLDATSFDHYYATVQTNLVLPIELLNFDAQPKGEGVNCIWETASEINNDYFDVERSIDGKEFEAIGRVKGFGHGTSSETRKYSLMDYDHCEGIRYYRLKQVDIDGLYSYSDVVAVKCLLNKDFINVYPNPAKTNVFCTFYETKIGTVKLQWLDMVGKIIKEEIHTVEKGYNTIQSDVSDLSQGIYFLRIKETENFPDENDRQIKFLMN